MPVQREVSRGPRRETTEGSVAIRRNQRRREGLKGTSKHVSPSSREGGVAVWQSLSGEAVGPMAWGVAATR